MPPPVPYTIKRSKRARHMRLSAYADGRVVVTAPLHLALSHIEQFIASKSEWLASKIAYFKQFKGNITPRSNSRADFLKHANRAYALATERINHFNKTYNFHCNGIRIKNTKTRWGSCSPSGDLNFSYKIALLHPRLADYIIVHELCHLGEFNHSKKFWELVAQTVPEYQGMRDELKKTRSI